MKKLFILGAVLCALCFITPQAMAGDGDKTINKQHHNVYGGQTIDKSKTVDKSNYVGGDNVGGNKVTKKGVFDNTTIIKDNKTGIFDNTVTIQDNLNDNQVGLINQKGADNQQGLVNQKGHHNIQVVGGSGAGCYDPESCGDFDSGDAQLQLQGQKQQQGQIQDQKQKQNQNQGQDQGQEQSTEVVITDNSVYEAEPNHIQGPEVVTPDSKLAERKHDTVKIEGDEILLEKFLTLKEGKMLSKETSDVEATASVKRTFKSTKGVNIWLKHAPKNGYYMGRIYVDSTGPDSNLLGVVGEAVEKACKLGATHIVLGKKDSKVLATGDSWNIGFGGGASIMAAENNTVAIAPNGGTGWGEAVAGNDEVPTITFKVYRDENMVVVD